MVSDLQRHSNLLSREETEHVVLLMGERCQPLAMTVVQLFQTGAPDHAAWRKRDAGVLVFERDVTRRNYFFRLYCLTRRQMVWEHEMYRDMDYFESRPFFHTFEAEDCMTAFNFANENEAHTLYNVVAAKQKRRQEKRSRAGQHQSLPVNNHLSSQHSASTPQLSNGSSQPLQQYRTLRGNNKRKDKSTKKITKADIGSPENFRHVSHVGWDPNKGFDLDRVEDPHLKEFFAKAGVSETQLQDPGTRDFIYAFINNHGGIDRVKNEVQVPDVPPPPVPARSVPPNPTTRTAPPPPPPPSRTHARPPAPPSQPPAATQPTPGPPPPPPPLRTLPQRQESASHGAPTPPPPPPPMVNTSISPAPAPPPAPGPLSAGPPAPPPAPDLRTALMDAIRSGTTLKHVAQEEKGRNGVSGTSGDTRAELMDQIRQGKELKAVVPAPRPAATNTIQQDSLAGALARALAERSRFIHSDSSGSSSEEEEDDDEWQD